MFRDHPQGVGLGDSHSPTRSYLPTFRFARKSLTESHTTPSPCWPSSAAWDLALYLIVLVSAFGIVLGRGPRQKSPPPAAHAPPEEERQDRRLYLVKAGLAAVMLALVVDSLLYNAFFEDPYMWTILALSAAAACRLTVWDVGSATITSTQEGGDSRHAEEQPHAGRHHVYAAVEEAAKQSYIRALKVLPPDLKQALARARASRVRPTAPRGARHHAAEREGGRTRPEPGLSGHGHGGLLAGGR